MHVNVTQYVNACKCNTCICNIIAYVTYTCITITIFNHLKSYSLTFLTKPHTIKAFLQNHDCTASLFKCAIHACGIQVYFSACVLVSYDTIIDLCIIALLLFIYVTYCICRCIIVALQVQMHLGTAVQ